MLFQHLLDLQGQVAPVRCSVEQVERDCTLVIKIIEKRNTRRCASEALTVPADFPQNRIQIRLALEDINLITRAAGEPQNPAAKDLARRAFEVINPQPRTRVVFFAG